MTKIKVGIVGCGPVADGHLSGWRKVQGSQIVAVADVNESVAKRTAETWKIPSFYPSLTQLLSHEKVDVIDICTPPQVHATLAVEAMKADADVLIEKPMTITTKDADAILQCKKATGKTVGVIHNWLFDRSVLDAKALVEKGALGEIMSIEVEALAPPSDSMAANERHWSHTLTGGRFSEMLVHPIYLVRHFIGRDIIPVDIQVTKLGPYPWMRSDELCAFFKSGQKLGRVYASFNSSRDAIFISLYGRRAILKLDVINSTVTFLPRRVTSRFNKGYDSIRQASQLTKSATKNLGATASGKWLSGHQKYISLFADCYLNHTDPPVTVEDASEVIRILEQMCKSIQEIQEKTMYI